MQSCTSDATECKTHALSHEYSSDAGTLKTITNRPQPKRRIRRRRRMAQYSFALPTSTVTLIVVFHLAAIFNFHRSFALLTQNLRHGWRRPARRPTSGLCKGRDGHINSDGSLGDCGGGGIGDPSNYRSPSHAPAQPLTDLILGPGTGGSGALTRTALLASSRSDKQGLSGSGDGKRRRRGSSSSGRRSSTTDTSTSVATVGINGKACDDPLVREIDEQRGTVLRHLRDKDLQAAYATIEEMVADFSQLKDSDAKSAASAIFDETIKVLTDVAFARGGGKTAAERIAIGMNALHLQVSPQSSLSRPYDAVTRATWIKALRALTGMRGVKRLNLRSSIDDGGTNGIVSTTPADASFGVLQRLVTGVGVRRSGTVKDKYAPAAAQHLDERDFSMVLNAFVSTGRMDMAHRVVALQERTETAPPLSPVAYSIMIKGYGKLRDANNVEMMLSHAKSNGVTPDTVMYNSLIDAYVNCDMIYEAKKAFTALTGRNGGDMSSMPTPDIRSYNTMLKGFAQNGDLGKALELSRLMDSSGLWNEVTTNTLVKAAVVAREFDAAEDILSRFTGRHSSSFSATGKKKRGKKQQHPNIEAYTELIDGYGKAKMLDRALDAFKLMRQRGVNPNAYSYTCLVSAMARSGKIEEAEKLLGAMESAGVRPTVVTYNSFISAMLGNAPPPVSTADVELGPENFISDEHTRYNERIVDSLRLLSRMTKSDARPNALTVSTIVDGLGKCFPPRIEQAKWIVAKLDQDGKVSCQDKRVGTALIHACGDNGDFQGSLEAFSSIAEPDTIALNAFLDACCKCDEVKTALKTFDQTISGAGKKKSKALRPDVISYTILISALLKMGTSPASDRAHVLYEEMKSLWGIKPDIALVDIVLSSMVGGGSLGLDDKDIRFTREVLRDAEGLNWAPGQLDARMKEVRFLLFGRTSEVWKNNEAAFGLEPSQEVVDPLFERKGWNKVDSGFRLWGGGLDKRFGKKKQTKSEEEEVAVVDEFLESHGWNDVDSGFRLF